MSTDRATQIANIIKQRKGLIKNIETAEENIKNLLSSLRQLEVKRQEIIPQVREAGASVSLETIKLESLINKLEAEYEKLKNLKTRFSNSTLNIGVVGRMGQGKSTLLQSLTGLPDDVIPARQGKACTAVRSTICHRSEREIEAVVTFHTEESFLKEVILPYFEKLNLSRKVDSIDDFANYGLTDISNVSLEGATYETMYGRLYKDYFIGLGGYRKLLNQPPLTVTREKIKKYVSQDRNPKNNLIDYEHLAVHHVEIFCPFPKSNIGQIALIDVPGMGDFKLGDEKLMLETLGKEVDVVLFVCQPGHDRYGWITQDTNLYDQAATALNDLADRAFMVLNLHSTRNNQNGCDSQKADVDNRNVRMQFAQSCIIANCASDNANNEVFEPVLKYLETEITKLDKKYAIDCEKRLIKLHDQIKAQLQLSSDVMQQFADENKLFNEYFVGSDGRGGLWNDLTNSLGNLCLELRSKREMEDTEFKERVTKTIQTCQIDTGIPSLQEIESQPHTPGSYPSRYYEYLEEIRSNLSRHFLSLDGDLQKSLEAVKSEVKKILAKEGRLENLSNSEGSAFFINIASQFDRKESSLKLGLINIGEFNLSLSGRIQRLIRPHLEPLDPRRDSDDLAPPKNAQEVYERLKKNYDQVVNACKNELEKLYYEPNQIAYYMVEDFLDRVLYARGVKFEWEQFLRKKQEEVWYEFKLLGERKKVKEEWESLVDQAQLANELHLIRFLN